MKGGSRSIATAERRSEKATWLKRGRFLTVLRFTAHIKLIWLARLCIYILEGCGSVQTGKRLLCAFGHKSPIGCMMYVADAVSVEPVLPKKKQSDYA